ncbi:hypothetical protein CANARDRAFT_187525, partial [[Candida] arabinofermentans NRRL YB-2248]
MDEQHRITFNKLFTELFQVWAHLDSETGVLNTQIPSYTDYHEKDLKLITTSFLTYLDTIESDLKEFKNSSSVLSKYENNEFENVQDLYHDLKVASIIKIREYEDNEVMYQKVDQFYKISVELLLRECIRLGYSINQKQTENKSDHKKSEEESEEEEEEDDEEEAEESEDFYSSLKDTLSRDFEIISASYISKNGKVLSLIAPQGVPLFSSLSTFKSELDDREPVIDEESPFNFANVVANFNSLPASTISSISPHNPQKKNIIEILSDYTHPSWFNINVSQWLKHGETENDCTFAPTYDENRAVISNEWKNLTWLEQVGFKKIIEFKEQAEIERKEREANSVSESKELSEEPHLNGDSHESGEGEESSNGKEISNGDTNGDVVMEEAEQEEEQEQEQEKEQEQQEEQIDLENLFKWNADCMITKSEKKAIRKGKTQKSISKMLLELNELRKSRILSQPTDEPTQPTGRTTTVDTSKISKPSKQEVAKFHQIKRALTGLIKAKNIQPKLLDIKFSSKLPVLQANYGGSLPAMVGIDHTGHMTGRLSGINKSSKRRR